MDKNQPNDKTNGDSELLKLQDSLLEKESFRHNARSGSDSSVKMVDSVLAKEFSNLTLEERSKTYEELHGVDDSVEETPEFVQHMLLQLDNELEKLVTDSEAYRVAMAQDPAYVRNVNFRLCFLRCTGFHPEKAAARLLAFLEGKLRYFGRELLTKRVQFNDLDRDDRACAKGGHMQVLASRDRSGRAVFVDINMMQDESFKTPMNRLKAFLYFWFAMAEDEENQKRGVVLLSMQMGSVDPTSVNKELWRESPRIMAWLPLRCCAVHFCCDDNILVTLARIALVGSPPDIRSRHRFHHGTYTEIMYSLLGYGLPVDVFPLTEAGVIKKTNLNRWINKYLARDKHFASGGSFFGWDLPTRNDVLLGKGKPIQQHPGNSYMRMLVEAHLEDYKNAKLGSKNEVVATVFRKVKERPSKFLMKGKNDWWHEIPDGEAIDKVSRAFLAARIKEKETEDRGVFAAKKPRGERNGENNKLHDALDKNSIFLSPQGKRPRDSSGNCCQ